MFVDVEELLKGTIAVGIFDETSPAVVLSRITKEIVLQKESRPIRSL